MPPLTHLLIVIGFLFLVFIVGMVFAEKEQNKRKAKQPADPQSGHYDSASLEDRFAERAMTVFMQAHKLRAKSLEMDYELVANASYEMARAMLKSRNLWRGAPGKCH